MRRLVVSSAVIAMLSAFALQPVCRAQASLVGDWEGILNAGGNEIHIAWHVTAAANGSFTSTLENRDEGISGVKGKVTEVKDSKFTLTVDDQVEANGETINIKGTMEGTLSADGNEVTGIWVQQEPEQPPAEVHLKRVAAPAAAPPNLPRHAV